MFNNKSPLPSKKKGQKQMRFTEAIEFVTSGKKIQRLEWADKEEYGFLDDNILKIYRDKKLHNWILSEGDLLATDWMIV